MESIFLSEFSHEPGECNFCDVMREDKKIFPEKNSESGPRLRDLGPGPSLGTVTKEQLPPRDVDDSDLKHNKIPVAFRDANTEGVQDSKVKDVVVRYLKDLSEMINTCTGLLLVGKQGVGKSAIAAMIAMEALRQRFSVYVATHAHLQELRFDDKPVINADGQSPVHRIHTADLLILDDFNESFLNDKVFGPIKLETLIAERNRWRRTTIMTTRLLNDTFKKEPMLKSLFGLMQETMVGVVLSGEDLRLRRNQEMKNRLGIAK